MAHFFAYLAFHQPNFLLKGLFGRMEIFFGDPGKILEIPRFAILMAAYNGTQWIEAQVESIFYQKSIEFHLFISVDLSEDETYEWCKKLEEKFHNVTVLAFGKRYGGAAKNFFRLIRDVNFSGFNYVSFADQDDIWLPNKLSRAHEIIKRNEVDAYSSNVIAFWPDGRKVLVDKSQSQTRWDFLYEAAGPGCTYVIKNELAQALQDSVRSHWEEIKHVGLHDWFFYAFARANGYRWVIDDFAGLLYRQHQENHVGANFGWYAFVTRTQTILSGWGLVQSVLISKLIGLHEETLPIRRINGGRMGKLWLACHAWHFRRRLRDKFLFAISCLVLFLVGNRR